MVLLLIIAFWVYCAFADDPNVIIQGAMIITIGIAYLADQINIIENRLNELKGLWVDIVTQTVANEYNKMEENRNENN